MSYFEFAIGLAIGVILATTYHEIKNEQIYDERLKLFLKMLRANHMLTRKARRHFFKENV